MITCEWCDGTGCAACNGNGKVGEWTAQQQEYSRTSGYHGNTNASKVTPEQGKTILKMRSEGISFGKIAKIIGVSRGCIQGRLNKIKGITT